MAKDTINIERLEKTCAALLSMQRNCWEQGVAAQAFLELGKSNIVMPLPSAVKVSAGVSFILTCLFVTSSSSSLRVAVTTAAASSTPPWPKIVCVTVLVVKAIINSPALASLCRYP